MHSGHLIRISQALGTTSIPHLECGSLGSPVYCRFHNSRNEVFSVDILRMDKHSIARIRENAENKRLSNRRENWYVLGAEGDDRPGQLGGRIDDMASKAVACSDICCNPHCRNSHHAHRQGSRNDSRDVTKEFPSWCIGFFQSAE